MEIRIKQIGEGWTYTIYQNNIIVGYREGYYTTHPSEAFDAALNHLNEIEEEDCEEDDGQD